jgi:uncharacterized protein (DUF934 family)
MPRQLLRNGAVVLDDWEELNDAPLPGGTSAPAVIIDFDRWQRERETLSQYTGKLGVKLEPAHPVEDLVADLPRLSLVAANFPGPSDGRGYTQGRLLRERYGFKGELRASGYVRLDQVFFLARCGFNALELPDGDLQNASTAFKTFTAAYQPSNDAGLPTRLTGR